MFRKIYSLILLLGMLHLAAVIQACCGEPMKFIVSTQDVLVAPWSRTIDNFGLKELPPFDRNRLRLFITLIPEDTFARMAKVVTPFLSGSFATSCEEAYQVFSEHVEEISIMAQTEAQTPYDVTDEFVVEVSGNELYQELPMFLAANRVTQLELVYKQVPVEDSIGFLIETRLSDRRIFSDTVSILLK